jgi:hypothetical protein
MAARRRKVALNDDWKANIRAGMLLTNLYKHAMGQKEMQKSQIEATKVILAKLVPDLARTELTGADGQPLVVRITGDDAKL